MNTKIYACYSETHRPLLERHFLPSIPNGFDVVLRRFDQVCPSGKYRSDNWGTAMQNKILLILEAIENETEAFVFSDVDIRFYDFSPNHVIEDLTGGPEGSYDIRCQEDFGSFCVGFMLIRPNRSTEELFRRTLDHVTQCNDDQIAFNEFALPQLLAAGTKLSISTLPLERYWNIGHKWNGKIPLNNIAIHHGNWVLGIDNKMKLLNDVLAARTNPYKSDATS